MQLLRTYRLPALSITLLVAMLAGCASNTPPTAADRMREQASESQAQANLKTQLARDWERGSALVSTGEKRVRDGEKRVRDAEREMRRARAEIERGQREIAEGRKLVQDSEQRFTDNFPGISLIPGV